VTIFNGFVQFKKYAKRIERWLMFYAPGEQLELTQFVENVFREELGLDKR